LYQPSQKFLSLRKLILQQRLTSSATDHGSFFIFFVAQNKQIEWLQFDSSYWKKLKDYRFLRDIINGLVVVYDAEHGVKLFSDFKIIVHNEEQQQFWLQVVENHRQQVSFNGRKEQLGWISFGLPSFVKNCCDQNTEKKIKHWISLTIYIYNLQFTPSHIDIYYFYSMNSGVALLLFWRMQCNILILNPIILFWTTQDFIFF
jgi:hypothetical protein